MTVNEPRYGAGALSERYDAALLWASELHRRQMRKNGDVPYLSHLLRVSGLALDYGCSEDVAIAALLHDSVEDCGGIERLKEIRERFGNEVAAIVNETTDSTVADRSKKAPWKERKETFIARLERASDSGVLVCACDKIDNVSALNRSLTNSSNREAILLKFKGGAEGTAWYFSAVLDVVQRRSSPAANELEKVVLELKELINVR
ncbi:MAG: HD domain-containing protein [Thermoguttaceae bacterium]